MLWQYRPDMYPGAGAGQLGCSRLCRVSDGLWSGGIDSDAYCQLFDQRGWYCAGYTLHRGEAIGHTVLRGDRSLSSADVQLV